MADHEDVVTIRYLLTGSVAFVALTKQMLRSAGLLLLVPAAGVYTIVWAILHPGGEMNVGTGCLMLGLGVVFFLGMPFLQTRALMKGLGFGDETTLRVFDSGMELKGGEVKARVKWSRHPAGDGDEPGDCDSSEAGGVLDCAEGAGQRRGSGGVPESGSASRERRADPSEAVKNAARGAAPSFLNGFIVVTASKVSQSRGCLRVWKPTLYACGQLCF